MEAGNQKEDAAGSSAEAVASLVRLMDRLRADCPWDRKQTFRDLAGYLLEECYEALDALERESLNDLEGELGDLLFQIVFLSKLGKERGVFDLASVARRIHDKMVARHPHVFGDSDVKDAGAVRVQWEALKKKERDAEGGPSSPFDGVPSALPALLKAARMGSRAADLGFDWVKDEDVLRKLDEEVAEFKVEVLAAAEKKEGEEGAMPDSARVRLANEIGDVLFTVVNVARRHGVDPEAALQATNARFRRRFEEVVRRVHEAGGDAAKTPLMELDRLWDEVKTKETERDS